MNFPFFIARKYFLSGKKKNFINVISIISMVVVSIGTMCLIIALSVFNGLEGLLRSMYGNFDPDIVITPTYGKSFESNSDHLAKIRSVDGILGVSEVIEDNVLVEYKESQRLVRMKGVSRDFDKYSGIKNVMVAGEFPLVRDSIGYALIGRGVQYDLSLSLKNDFYTLQMYYPKDIAPGVVNPSRMYNLLNIIPGGIFAIEKYYDDNYVFVPVEFAKDLLNYGNKLTSYDVYLQEDRDPATVKKQIQANLGEQFKVKLGEELHSDLYKVLKIEKLFVFLILVAIIGIASINIFFSLTMLVIEKKKDISILFAQGASTKLIRNIFLYEGSIVAFSGAGVGLILGISLSLLQQHFGLVGMGMDTAVINSYPVKIEVTDILLTVIAVILITILASIQPAIKASKSFSTQTLQ
ncbi:lipoprotein-releasing system permease protein [Ekhidna lutea]|uniref:Lipoprotein-releasing system permease protein n=1 Tax=Ekhidna lutea TaxID=447679 RepID=A0A239EC39_EKHLU|nr:FtsX-like permease family protein [Ekhidna lutea]SNS42031.1 lipoprotein-releasing system permease protein [Ekhidna lutea]